MSEEKRIQRERCLRRRRALSAAQRTRYSAAICRRLIRLPEAQNARTILSYRAVWDEAELAAFHDWARERGGTLAFPVSEPGGILRALVPDGPESWITGRFGILCPDPARCAALEPEELELVLAPCVGFDGALERLGRGGGYYDRYLPRCVRACRVMCAFEAQRLDRVSREETDCPAQVLVTEGGVFRRE